VPPASHLVLWSTLRALLPTGHPALLPSQLSLNLLTKPFIASILQQTAILSNLVTENILSTTLLAISTTQLILLLKLRNIKLSRLILQILLLTTLALVIVLVVVVVIQSDWSIHLLHLISLFLPRLILLTHLQSQLLLFKRK